MDSLFETLKLTIFQTTYLFQYKTTCFYLNFNQNLFFILFISQHLKKIKVCANLLFSNRL